MFLFTKVLIITGEIIDPNFPIELPIFIAKALKTVGNNSDV